MSRSINAVAGAAALLCLGLAGQAQAQSNVTVRGLVDASVGRFEMAGGEAVSKVQSGNMTTSFIGFGGKEELGGGLKATFAIESFLRVDSGQSGRFGANDTDNFWARDAYVGLETSYGEYRFGRTTTTMFVSTLAFNAFGDSFGFSPSIIQVLTPTTMDDRGARATGKLQPFYGDTGWSNSAAFHSKSFGGFSLNLQAGLGEDRDAGHNVGGSIVYANGPLAATLSYSKVKNDDFADLSTAGFDNQETKQVGASYDFGAVKLFGQYTEVDTEQASDTSADIWGVGAAVPLGGGKLLGQYGQSKNDLGANEYTNKTLTLGYDYNLSKRTDCYVVYMQDKLTGESTGDSYAVGIRHRF